MIILWNNPESKITQNFTVKDALWLGLWKRLATEKDGIDDAIKDELVKTLQMLEQVRSILCGPILVSSCYRPLAYSPLVGGYAGDVHCKGLAVDFVPGGPLSIRSAKDLMHPHLESLNIRMELGTTTWIHCDRREPGPSGRYFVP